MAAPTDAAGAGSDSLRRSAWAAGTAKPYAKDTEGRNETQSDPMERSSKSQRLARGKETNPRSQKELREEKESREKEESGRPGLENSTRICSQVTVTAPHCNSCKGDCRMEVKREGVSTGIQAKGVRDPFANRKN
ncbi:hypothetical protein R3P38DRAFT_2765166 [Favolaschia claudopus]|uniref:Uncharacterized protein n=1 Tax=Favolaschia claudopus TaxID=2862362 RepID=A0AAW0D458_9AGAR